jgi:hypothetical protein
MTIDIAITVCNEHEELDWLLNLLHSMREDSNLPFFGVNVQGDEGNVTNEVLDVINNYKSLIRRYEEFPLNNDFASFKNNLFNICFRPYILQLDADEIIGEHLIKILHEVVDMDKSLDLVYIPRINTVKGITDEDIKNWGWRIQKVGPVDAINFPDYQGRFYKNEDYLEWSGNVHERIIGAYNTYKLTPSEEYCIYHPKTIDKQRQQNKFYNDKF